MARRPITPNGKQKGGSDVKNFHYGDHRTVAGICNGDSRRWRSEVSAVSQWLRVLNPVEIFKLKLAVANGNHKTVREHGWKLWAEIMQPDADGQWPIWYTWPNTKAAFAPPRPPGGANLNASAAAGPGKSLIQLNASNAAGRLPPCLRSIRRRLVIRFHNRSSTLIRIPRKTAMRATSAMAPISVPTATS